MKPLLNVLTNPYAKKTLLSLFTSIVFLFPNLGKAQTAPNLDDAAPYVFFTSIGAFGNIGSTAVTGSIGTNNGPLTGFPPGTVTGTIDVQNGASLAAAADVCAAYTDLDGRTCDRIINATLDGQTLTPGISCIGSAASLAGVLTLTGTATSVFIIQIDGRFDMATNAQIILSGGAKIENVFFQVNGVFAMGTNAVFRGTVITGPGAIELATGAAVYGRALACGGAISLDNNIGMSAEGAVLPLILSEFTATRQNNTTLIKWKTQSEINTKEFIVEHSTTGAQNTWTSKGKIIAAGHNTTARHYSMVDNNPSPKDNYYRLKSVDNDNSYSLSQLKYVYFSKAGQQINAFPIPFKDVINLTGVEKGSSIILSDLSGNTIKKQTATGTGNEKIHSSNLTTGSYFIKIITADGKSSSIKINKQ